MAKSITAYLFFWLFSLPLFSQALPVVIDGKFDDWQNPALFQDAIGDGGTVDFLEFSVANDESYLFVRLKVAQEFSLTDANKIVLYLDTDNNPATGALYNGIGAELAIYPGDRYAIFQAGLFTTTASLNDIRYRSLPTVSGKDFEIALRRDVKPNGVTPLFTGSTIRLAFKDTSGASGDAMPNAGSFADYVFDETPVLPFEPVNLQKESPEYIRLMTYNTLWNGLDDQDRLPYFKRIISVLKPDIVTFNECWDVTPGMAATFMNTAVPLPGFQDWHAVKLDAGNITVSRFPITQSWLIRQGSRLTASLIDLPANYTTDLLVINAHFKCCSDDATRQKEADAFVKFMLDAKAPGGEITLPQNTPFVLSGDLNLVGFRQQLTTLLTGQVINTGTYGMGGPLDWDGTALEDIIVPQSDQRMAYTWRDDANQYPPSRLDYHIYSNSAMGLAKSFTVETEAMSPERLALYGLQQFDTYNASDHFPRVSDFILPVATAVADFATSPAIHISPNPFSERISVSAAWAGTDALQYSLTNAQGNLLAEGETGASEFSLETGNLPAGIYFLTIKTGQYQRVRKMVKF